MLVAGPGARGKAAPDGETMARVALGCLGIAMCLGPPVAGVAFGWLAAPLAPMVPIGALFVILAAFYERIAGEVRFGLFRVSIRPAVSAVRAPSPRADPADSAAATSSTSAPTEASE